MEGILDRDLAAVDNTGFDRDPVAAYREVVVAAVVVVVVDRDPGTNNCFAEIVAHRVDRNCLDIVAVDYLDTYFDPTVVQRAAGMAVDCCYWCCLLNTWRDLVYWERVPVGIFAVSDYSYCCCCAAEEVVEEVDRGIAASIVIRIVVVPLLAVDPNPLDTVVVPDPVRDRVHRIPS